MGAVFAVASADMTVASPEAVASGMRITFAVAGVLTVAALAIAAMAAPRPLNGQLQPDGRGRKT